MKTIMINGKITTPPLMVENLGKNCRIAIPRKNKLATLLNCSSKFLGTKVITVYFELII